MLDLKKYLKKAEADPSFKAKLLKNANQAIKDEFGEDLPYKLKCKEKLAFEVEAMNSLSDVDVSSVAGGNGDAYNKFVKRWAAKAKKDGRIGGAALGDVSGGNGDAYDRLVKGWAAKAKKDGRIGDAALGNVAGGNGDAYNKFVKGWAAKAKKDGALGNARFKPTARLGNTISDTQPLPTLSDAIDSHYFGPLPQNPQYGELSERNLGDVSGGERTAAWNSTYDTNERAASEYRRAYGFNKPGAQVFGPNTPGRTIDPFIKSNDGSYNEEYEHWRKKRADGFIC